MNTLRVAVVGARGRMGATVVEAVSAAPDMEVVARIDVDDQIATDTLNQATVAVDFTAPAVTEDNVHALLDCGVNVVVGTTGWTDESRGRVAEHAERAGRSVIIAPNFAMSAILAMKFAEMAAPYFESAEVIEMHHPNKLDAPSGTAPQLNALPVPAAKQDAIRCPMRPAPTLKELAAASLTVSPCTPCGCVDWSHMKKSCWETRASSSSSAPIPLTAHRSCPASCSLSVTCTNSLV